MDMKSRVGGLVRVRGDIISIPCDGFNVNTVNVEFVGAVEECWISDYETIKNPLSLNVNPFENVPIALLVRNLSKDFKFVFPRRMRFIIPETGYDVSIETAIPIEDFGYPATIIYGYAIARSTNYIDGPCVTFRDSSAPHSITFLNFADVHNSSFERGMKTQNIIEANCCFAEVFYYHGFPVTVNRDLTGCVVLSLTEFRAYLYGVSLPRLIGDRFFSEFSIKKYDDLYIESLLIGMYNKVTKLKLDRLKTEEGLNGQSEQRIVEG